MDLCNPNQIKDLLARHGFHFSKSLGQNFLIEDWVIRDIAAASGAEENTGVLEIGPGIGPLTHALAGQAKRVAAVELDSRLYPILADTLKEYENVVIIPGDITKVDLEELVTREFSGMDSIVCANLPYNITTPVLTKLILSGLFSSVTVMIQREVARRICAKAGTPDYGAFSVFCQYHADCRFLFEVPPTCFLPPPKVTSAVIRMTLRDRPPVEVVDEEMFFRVVKASFALRRKTLLNGLCAGFGSRLSKEALQECIAACGLDSRIRGEQLDLSGFAALSRVIAEKIEG